MTSGEVVAVRGADTLARTLRSASRDLRDLSGPGTRAAGLVARAAQTNAPRRTGRLASTIRGTAGPDHATVTAGAGIAYAGVIEGGWRRHGIEPRHYLRRAWESNATATIDVYSAGIVDIVDQVRGL